MKVYTRTENGTATEVSLKDGLSEINHAMLSRRNGQRKVRTMSSISRNDYAIEYQDGGKVTLVVTEKTEEAPAETESKGRRIVTVKGKRYVVGTIVPAQTDRKKIGENSYSLPHPAYVAYWSERSGETFGATRSASASNKPGTVGRAIWDAVNR
jgi:hypothetical protein